MKNIFNTIKTFINNILLFIKNMLSSNKPESSKRVAGLLLISTVIYCDIYCTHNKIIVAPDIVKLSLIIGAILLGVEALAKIFTGFKNNKST